MQPLLIFVALQTSKHTVVILKFEEQQHVFYVEKGVIHPAVLVDLVDGVPLVAAPPADGAKYLRKSRHGALRYNGSRCDGMGKL